MIRLGITGGIGSGKSTVAALLAGFATGVVLDADAISSQPGSRHAGGLSAPEPRRVDGVVEKTISLVSWIANT